jgi:hypothetical protein
MKFMPFLFFAIISFYSCDTFAGATMRVNNINIPIEKIYADIKENNNFFNYESIKLEYEPSHESFGIFPEWGKQISEPYYYIHIWVYGFGAIIKYIDSKDGAYLHVSAIYLHGAPKDILEFTEYKMGELKQFIKEKYGLDDNNLIIGIYK